MTFTLKERLSLINQYRILSKLYPEDSDHYDELIEILENGYSIFYSQITQWLSDDMPETSGKLVLNILDMYRALEDYKRFSKDDEVIKHHRSFFMGFDGNNETEYMSFARFLIVQQGKFSEQMVYLNRNDNLNSHMPMVDTYARMLDKWHSFENKWQLSKQQVLEILNS